MKALGTHIIVELSDCNARILSDVDQVASILVAAAKAANAEVLQTAFHRFAPQGVSGVVVIAESHLSIHTWPEERLIAIDLFSCGSIDAERVAAELARLLRLDGAQIRWLARGRVAVTPQR